jgi:hypothetical protein
MNILIADEKGKAEHKNTIPVEAFAPQLTRAQRLDHRAKGELRQ